MVCGRRWEEGSDLLTEYHVKEDNPQVTVMNYINLDMVEHWLGGGGAPHGDPDPQIDEDGYPKDSEVWPLRVYIGPSPNHDQLISQRWLAPQLDRSPMH